MDNVLPDKEKVALYTSYMVWYINDVAGNCIKELAPLIAQKDKETKKIYGALMKRVNAYFRKTHKNWGEYICIFADFCGEMDDICDPLLEDYKRSVYQAFVQSNVPYADYYTQIEVARGIATFADCTVRNIIRDGVKVDSEMYGLYYYMIDDLERIIENLAKWAYRDIPQDIEVDCNTFPEILTAIKALGNTLIDCEVYNQCLMKAMAENKDIEVKHEH